MVTGYVVIVVTAAGKERYINLNENDCDCMASEGHSMIAFSPDNLVRVARNGKWMLGWVKTINGDLIPTPSDEKRRMLAKV